MGFLEKHEYRAWASGELVGYFSDLRCAAKTAVFHASRGAYVMVTDSHGVRYEGAELRRLAG